MVYRDSKLFDRDSKLFDSTYPFWITSVCPETAPMARQSFGVAEVRSQ
jgi:hypothetical protein